MTLDETVIWGDQDIQEEEYDAWPVEDDNDEYEHDYDYVEDDNDEHDYDDDYYDI